MSDQAQATGPKHDVPDVIEILEQIVAEFGRDHVAPRFEWEHGQACRYVTEDGKPSCIVGQVLAKIGHLMPANIERSWPAAGRAPSELAPYAALFTEEANVLLNAAQVHQDGAAAWGYVLDYVKEAHS